MRKETLAKVLVGKTGAAIPACVKAKERVGEKLKATVPKYVNAAKGKLKLAKDWIEATHLFTDTLLMMYLEYKMQERIEKKRESSNRLWSDVQQRGQKIKEGIQRELDLYWQNTVRGVTGRGAAGYWRFDSQWHYEGLAMLFRMGKIISTQHPTYDLRMELYEKIRKGILEGSDKLGNTLYNSDMAFISDFFGEAFHSSDREASEEPSNLASLSGAFVNGFFGTGLFGTVDGITGLAMDPLGAGEGIMTIQAHPEETIPILVKSALEFVDENLIHGDGESRSRVAGAVGFEIVSAILTGGAGTAAKAGDKAGDGGRMSRALDKLGDIRRGIQNGFSRGAKKVLGSEAAEKAAGKADDVLKSLNRILNGAGREPALASGVMDDLDDYGRVRQWLEKKRTAMEMIEESGVKIHRAEGVGDDLGNALDGMGEKAVEGGKYQKPYLKISNKQFGKKVGKHAEDFGLNANNQDSRNWVRNKINDIFNNPTQIKEGEWRGLGPIQDSGNNAPGPARFYIQGKDVVVTDLDGNFVTILKDGINNTRVSNAVQVWSQ